MADVYAVFGTLLAVGIIFPGMLTAVWLIFPNTVGRARGRLDRTPWRCFFLGLVIVSPLILTAGFLLSLPFALMKMVGVLLVLAGLTGVLLGAAGMAALMGDRLSGLSGDHMAPWGAFVRGAVVLELAAAFPLVGWFVAIPAVLLASAGAAVFALMSRMPGSTTPLPVADPIVSQA